MFRGLNKEHYDYSQPTKNTTIMRTKLSLQTAAIRAFGIFGSGSHYSIQGSTSSWAFKYNWGIHINNELNATYRALCNEIQLTQHGPCHQNFGAEYYIYKNQLVIRSTCVVDLNMYSESVWDRVLVYRW